MSDKTNCSGGLSLIKDFPNLSAASHYLSELTSNTLIIVPADEIERVYSELMFFSSGSVPIIFPGFNLMPYEDRLISNKILSRRMLFFYQIGSRNTKIVVAEPKALFYKINSINRLKSRFFNIKTGKPLDLYSFVETLSASGYANSDQVISKGQYRVKGGIVDCFIPIYDDPIRIEFYGDTIDSMRFFSCKTQLSTAYINKISVTPANEFGKSFHTDESIWKTDYFKSDPADLFADFSIIIDGRINFEILYNEAYWRYKNRAAIELIAPSVIISGRDKIERLKARSSIAISHIKSKYTELKIAGSIKNKFDRISNLNADKIAIISENYEELKRIKPLLKRDGIKYEKGYLADNFCLGDSCYISFEQLFKHKKREIEDRPHAELIKIDDFVVHKDYGIGKFAGIVEIADSGFVNQVYKIIYRNDEILYLPISDAAKIAKYDGAEPDLLDSLGSEAFKKRKEKAYKAILIMAKRYAAIYAKRFVARRTPYDLDNPYLFQFEESFPYVRTDDQKKAIADLKSDMLSDIPIDRLITGGTGFGKTEVVLVATAAALFSNRQVMVVAPTTLLADQHYDVFSKRFSEFPVNIKRIDLKSDITNIDNFDILIGTASVTKYADKLKRLSLVIVDEEQRFGVKFKEQLKKNRPDIDVVTVSATPIPRTLQMALSGIWDISTINTPPRNRIPIDTRILAKTDKTIQDAILWELRQNGQVYFVHNRIEDIEEIYDKIAALVPHAKIAIIHGQMIKSRSKVIMNDFRNHKYDVLLSTAIIESGLDISDVNTIIVDEAQNFGLSDLYQLRGRVGRSDKFAKAVFLIDKAKNLTENAKKRLAALNKFSKGFGSSMELSVSDNKIRGSGNPLGIEQKGKSFFVGFSLYHKMVKEAAGKIRGTYHSGTEAAELSWDIASYIPTGLMNENERLIWYQRLGASDLQDTNKLIYEAHDRYGRLPDEFEAIISAAVIKNRAAAIGAKSVDFHNKKLIVSFSSNCPIDLSNVMAIITSYNGKAGFIGDYTIYFEKVNGIPEIYNIIKKFEKKTESRKEKLK